MSKHSKSLPLAEIWKSPIQGGCDGSTKEKIVDD
jgi:hypothetical protein